jgi:hypothetical protein
MFAENKEKKLSLKNGPLLATDAHLFAHRPRQLAPATKQGGEEKDDQERGRRTASSINGSSNPTLPV